MEIELVVLEIGRAADDVVQVWLGSPGGGELPAWEPGAHIDLILRDDLVRQYSLCGAPSERNHWRIAVHCTPESRGGSKAVHNLVAGDRVRASVPRNHFPLVSAPKYTFVAGGVGITPLLPMISFAQDNGAEWELFYGGRGESGMAFLAELAAYGDRVHVVTGLLDLPRILGTDGVVYACGPSAMLDACLEIRDDLRFERFTALEVDTSADTSFSVVLDRSGLTLSVPHGKSIFEIVREAGVDVLGSCLEGTCGTCETEVIEGEVDHRCTVLTAEERASNECMMICVSRARTGSLTLDL